MKIVIVAISDNGGIGNKGEMAWKCKEDMEFFKKTTLNKTVVMGRRTFESIGKALPSRNNIVISSTMCGNNNVMVYKSLEEVFEKYEDLFIIGGEMVYKKAFELGVDKVYVSKIKSVSAECDTFFPMNELCRYPLVSTQEFKTFILDIYEKLITK